jgi:3-phenylpropionate/trans-cinnamate dioxygenase ferredoxin subunit
VSDSDYIEALSTDELAEGEMTKVDVDGHKMLLANVGGTYYASDLHCPHLHADLSKGTLNGTVLTCPLHHSQFDLRDGGNLAWTDWKGTAKSMAEFVRHPRPLRVYETHVEDGTVCVGPQKEPPSGA